MIPLVVSKVCRSDVWVLQPKNILMDILFVATWLGGQSSDTTSYCSQHSGRSLLPFPLFSLQFSDYDVASLFFFQTFSVSLSLCSYWLFSHIDRSTQLQINVSCSKMALGTWWLMESPHRRAIRPDPVRALPPIIT